MQIQWKPQEKQAEALISTEDEILYGGSRGGGKTDAGQAWLLYDKDHPRYRALVLRRNADDLKDWIDRAKYFYKPCGAEAVGATPEFRFPSGAIIRTGHLKDSSAYTKYQGQEYQKMLFEELTHIALENDYEKVLASCRSTIPEIKPQSFSTTNPDGPGYKWVKRRFRIPDYPTVPIRTVDEKTGRTRIFIPARLQDNPILMNADPGYIRFLQSIQDEDLRNAWLNGSWAGFSTQGAYFATQVAEARKDGRITKVPYDTALEVHTWWDLGVGDSTAIWFFQTVGIEWRVIDYYEASGEGLNHYKQVLNDKKYVYGMHYAPHDIEVREFSTGRSRLETARTLGIDFRIAPNLPIDDGINAVRMRFNTLWFDETKCERGLEAISQYKKDFNEKLGEFKNHPLHDWTSHAADALRYWAVTPFNNNGYKPYKQPEPESASMYMGL